MLTRPCVQERTYRWLTLLQKAGDNWAPDVYHNLAEIRERVDWLANTHHNLSKIVAFSSA